MKFLRFIPLLLALASSAFSASTVYWFDSVPFTPITYGEFNPAPLFSTTNSGHTVKELQSGQSIVFASTSTSILINSYTSTAAGRSYVLLQDDVQVGSQVDIPATGSGSYSDYTMGTGLSGSHEYEIVCITPVQPHPTSWFDANITLDTGTFSSVTHTQRIIWGMYGDSITGMSSAHQTNLASPIISDCRYGDMWIGTHATHTAMYISGTAGGQVYTTGRDSTGNIPTNVDAVRIEYGIHDIGAGVSQANFTAAYTTMLDNIRTRIGASKWIICLQPFPTAGSSDGTRNTYGGYIQTAITNHQTNAGGDAFVTYAPTVGWITTGTDMLPDGTHPNAACYAILANRQIPIFAASAIGITGPSTGSVGTPTSAFTCTMSGGGTFTGDQSVVLTTSSGTIDATAVGGTITNDNTSAVTIAPANGQTSFTFTCTAAAQGTITITPTTTQGGWRMPSATTYDASTTYNITTLNITNFNVTP